jgi:hypothetical protein
MAKQWHGISPTRAVNFRWQQNHLDPDLPRFDIRCDRSDPANFDYKADSKLAAGKYRISLKSKLPHLWLDIKSGSDLVTSNLDDGFGDHLTSKLDGFGDHVDLNLDGDTTI